MKYAGIGHRKGNVPTEKALLMVEIGFLLAESGYTLHSGNATGSDHYFHVGCKHGEGDAKIFLPWKRYNHTQNTEDTILLPKSRFKEAYEILLHHEILHGEVTGMSKKFFCRNVAQILGEDLNSPVDFVVCYTYNGKHEGGTGIATQLAEKLDIPIYNLFYDKYDLDFFGKLVGS